MRRLYESAAMLLVLSHNQVSFFFRNTRETSWMEDRGKRRSFKIVAGSLLKHVTVRKEHVLLAVYTNYGRQQRSCVKLFFYGE